MYKLGIIGLGTIYKYQQQAVQKLDSIKLTAICDKDENKVYGESGRLGVVPYCSVERMLLDDGVDTVLLSTPTQTHYNIGVKVLNAGKHLLLEKPAALDMDEIADLYEAAQRNNVKLIVLYHAAFAKDLLWFMEHYEKELKQSLGPITGMECFFCDPYIKDGKLSENAVSLVGSWVDSGINCLSVMARFFEPSKVTLKSHSLEYGNYYGKINCKATVQYEAKTDSNYTVPVIIKTDWTLGINQKKTLLEFKETGGKVLLNHSEQKVLLYRSPDDEKNNKHLLLSDFSSHGERLAVHYEGVFTDAVNLLVHGRDNYMLTYNLHSLLLDRRLGIV